jgi:hypothetical protein
MVSTNMYRWRCQLTGFSGGPGVTTFYTYTDGSVALNSYLNTFYTALKAYMPNTLTVNFPAAVDLMDPITGFVSGSVGVTTAAAVTGTSASAYSAPSGLVIKWTTAGTVAAIPPKHGVRRVTGHTFLVPGSSACEGAGGLASPAAVSAVNGAVSALLTSVAGNLLIWTRPVWNSSGTAARNGQVSSILSGVCSPKMAVLTSRRD